MSKKDLLIDFADPDEPVADWNSPDLGDFTHDTLRRGSVSQDSRSRTTAADAFVLELPREARPRLPLDDVLPRYSFLKQLEREKRRTDRSKAPLSIVLFRFDGRGGDPLGDVDELLRILCESKRATDIVGYLSDDRVAVLLPDTGEEGTLVLARKVRAGAGDLGFSIAAATYPDRLFDDLNAEDGAVKDPNPFFPDNMAGTSEGSYAVKSSLDIVGAMVALILLSPLMFVIAILVAATSPGPVVFKQVRLGRRCVPFNFYKFRSMYCEVDDQIHRDYVAKLINGDLEAITHGEATKPLYKLKGDRRITRFGRFLRKTSMDELPQLFNVLKGDMEV
jgi:lipopolysaccharide/colanic/teichoic acid biosynthesis glycosyltransferase